MQQKTLEIATTGPGLYIITPKVLNAFDRWPDLGMLNCFTAHTSCSLTIQENADPSARTDLEEFAERLAPRELSWYRHTAEGPDDSPSHMKSATFGVSLNIPVSENRLALGTWQGIYLWEHRDHPHHRKVILTLSGNSSI